MADQKLATAGIWALIHGQRGKLGDVLVKLSSSEWEPRPRIPCPRSNSLIDSDEGCGHLCIDEMQLLGWPWSCKAKLRNQHFAPEKK